MVKPANTPAGTAAWRSGCTAATVALRLKYSCSPRPVLTMSGPTVPGPSPVAATSPNSSVRQWKSKPAAKLSV